MNIEKCKRCEFTIGNKEKPEELGCTKTYDWVIVQYLEYCPLDKQRKLNLKIVK
jgi:hypothetical protein